MAGVKLQFKARKEAEAEAEKQRIEAERRDELKRKRANEIAALFSFTKNDDPIIDYANDKDYENYKKVLEKRKADYEAAQEKIRQENERLKKEAAAKEAQRQAEEKKRIEKEQKERLIREEQERKERAEYEAKIKKEREERQKVEAELKAKADEAARIEAEQEAQRQAELSKGDAAKIKDLVNDLERLKTKYQFRSKNNISLYGQVGQLIDKIIVHIEK